MRMRRIEAGVYADPSGRYRVERVDSLGEVWSPRHGQFVESTSSVWTVVERPKHANNPEWPEIFEAMTKRKCVEHVEELLREGHA